MAEGIRRAVEGGGEVDGPGLKQALEEIPAFETGDVSGPIDFTAESHAGMQSSRLFRVESGQWAELTDFMEP
jgi:branched-chain amino acid transport system substrate-binding protein